MDFQLTELQANILELATEDYTDLPSLYSMIKQALNTSDENVALRTAQTLVKDLIKADYVRLYVDNVSGIKRQARLMTDEERRAALKAPESWLPRLRPNPDWVTPSIASTERGEEALHRYWGGR